MAAPEKGENFNETILKQLECPVCFEYCAPPIFQCTNGHNICFTCFPKVKECVLCRCAMTKVRNLFAEQVSSKIEYPCKFKSEGCTHKCLLSVCMAEHLKKCSYGSTCQMKVRDYQAEGTNNVYVQCNWRGKYTGLRQHVETKHHDWAARGATINVRFTLRKFQAILVSCHDEMFWCFFCLNRQQSQQAYVCCIGDEEKTKQFKYEIKLSSPNDECVIVNKGNVVHFENGLVEEYEKDESGKNTIVSGNQMLHRFVNANIFHCNIKIIKM